MEEISSEAVREVPPSAGSTYLVQLRSVVPLFVKTYGESSLMQRIFGWRFEKYARADGWRTQR